MTKNHMPEIAKMLGVEMGEHFSIAGFDSTKFYFSGEFYFSKTGLNTTEADVEELINDTLRMLITGNLEIVKLPFKPKENEPYWFWCNPIGGGGEVAKVYCRFGGDSLMCRECYMLGNCYRTEAECEADTAMKERIEKMERCKW